MAKPMLCATTKNNKVYGWMEDNKISVVKLES